MTAKPGSKMLFISLFSFLCIRGHVGQMFDSLSFNSGVCADAEKMEHRYIHPNPLNYSIIEAVCG